MRVVSWNVNGIRACVRHGFVDFVDRSGADIVGVQEVRARPEDIPAAARWPSGWHTAFTVAEHRGYSGVGIYSKLQPVRVDTSLGVPRFGCAATDSVHQQLVRGGGMRRSPADSTNRSMSARRRRGGCANASAR